MLRNSKLLSLLPTPRSAVSTGKPNTGWEYVGLLRGLGVGIAITHRRTRSAQPKEGVEITEPEGHRNVGIGTSASVGATFPLTPPRSLAVAELRSGFL